MSEAAAIRRRAFAAASPITEAMIHNLVHGFYAKIGQDPLLGPIFERVIAPEAWPEHLAKMCDFWSSVTLMSGRFKGSPMQAHLAIGELQPAHFARWLDLFERSAEEICPPAAAAIFVEKSRTIAASLNMALQLARGEFEAAVAG